MDKQIIKGKYMIKQLEIQNFKSIKKEKIKLKSFNLFCGENASGKTSCIHAMLAVLQDKKNISSLDGKIIRIGTFSELRNKEQSGNIEISVKDLNGCCKKLEYVENNILADNRYIVNEKQDKDFENLIFDKNLFYISSNRGIFNENFENDDNFGLNGRNSFLFLKNHRDSMMPNKYMEIFSKFFPSSKIIDNKKFEDHVRFWFEYITGETFNIDFIPYTYSSVLTYGNELKKRPINTGIGLSSVLPIIITSLGAVLLNNANYGLIVIENPEIYLHPLAQIKLMDYLEFIINFIQLIVETHSEYLLKCALEQSSRKNQICIFMLQGKNTKIKYLNKHEFKLVPYVYPELLYYAFNLYTIDLHIVLFSKLQEIAQKNSIKQFDTYLLNNFSDIPRKRREYNNTIYMTLPVYIRNCIDHPEQKNNNGHKYKFTNEELKKSIDFMISKL